MAASIHLLQSPCLWQPAAAARKTRNTNHVDGREIARLKGMVSTGAARWCMAVPPTPCKGSNAAGGLPWLLDQVVMITDNEGNKLSKELRSKELNKCIMGFEPTWSSPFWCGPI